MYVCTCVIDFPVSRRTKIGVDIIAKYRCALLPIDSRLTVYIL